jgi:hypothetical protein
MKRIFYTVLSVLLVFVLFGCIQNHTVIHVKPDGSGTIEETVLLSYVMLDFMESFAIGMTGSEEQKDDQISNNTTKDKGDSGKKEKKTRDDLISDMSKDAEKRAAQFGDRVKFVSVKPVKTDTAGGYTAVYAFQDIGQVKVNQNPSDKVDGKGTEKDNSSKKEEFILFKFVKGAPSKLVVTSPALTDTTGEKPGVPNKAEPVEAKPNKESDAQSIEMMKTLFKDMKLSISLQFDGTIVNTNATYRDGSTVTLMEMDFGKIINNSELFMQMSAAKPQSIEEVKALLKGARGLKIELTNPVFVEFK